MVWKDRYIKALTPPPCFKGLRLEYYLHCKLIKGVFRASKKPICRCIVGETETKSPSKNKFES